MVCGVAQTSYLFYVSVPCEQRPFDLPFEKCRSKTLEEGKKNLWLIGFPLKNERGHVRKGFPNALIANNTTLKPNKGRTITKVMGRGGEKKQKKFMQGKMQEKNSCKEEGKEKKFM